MFKGFSDVANLMKQAKEIQGRAAEMKTRLGQVRVEGTAGGGMVTVEASGDQKITACRIEPSLIESGDREMIEDLVVSASNQALEQARERAAAEMQQLAGGFNFPGLSEAMEQLGNSSGAS
jgi:DNA-binding YbaB/EbfC family protein